MLRFSDLVGHERQVRVLREAVSSGQVAHAYLFFGPSGVGKFQAAFAFAALILCEKGGEDACGTCQSCSTLARGLHPDLVVVETEPDRKVLRVELIRVMEQKLALKAIGGKGVKVAIIRDAEAMNKAAQSALLKTLEEPPGNSILVLVCNNRFSLQRTVLSRCQAVGFESLGARQVERALIQNHGRSPEHARILAAFSEGSLGVALGLDEKFLSDGRPKLIEAVRRLPGGGFSGVQTLAERLAREKDIHSSMAVLLSFYRDQVRYGLLGDRAKVQNSDLTPREPALSWQCGLRCLEDVYDTFAALEANANKRLTLEALFLKLSRRDEAC